MTLEYRFVPWTGLPAVDYVLSGEVEYNVMVPAKGGDEDEFVAVEYRNQFMNVTVSIYETNPFRYLDFQLLLMVILIAAFWLFVGILFYEFWWIPNQMAQGLKPLPTTDFVMHCYRRYIRIKYYELREKVLKEPIPNHVRGNNKKNQNNRLNANQSKSGSNTPGKGGGSDGWLKGTKMVGGRQRNQNNQKKKGKKNN